MRARWMLPAFGFLLLLSAIPVAHATTAVVPDNFPTVQSGIDSGRDTVLVRGGRYDEDLVANRVFALLAYPPSNFYDDTELPQVRGLAVARLPNSGLSLLVRGIRFRGKVTVNATTSGPLNATFEICRLDSGLSAPGDFTHVETLNVRGCTILGGMAVNAIAVNVLLNSVYGGGIKVYGEGYYTIRGNYVHGPAPFGINGDDDGGGSSIEANTIVATGMGITTGYYGALVSDNEVMDCTGSAFVGGTSRGTYKRNQVARCGGHAFDFAEGTYNLTLTHNVAVDCASGGLRTLGYCTADSNVIGRCGGPGFDIGRGSLHGNTSYSNQGSGFVVHDGSGAVTNNIAFKNLDYGLVWANASPPNLIGCNDWYGNSGGDVSGVVPGISDASVNPLFCELSNDDVHLSAGSPLLSLGVCGLVGALGLGCVEPVGVPLGNGAVRAFTVSPNPSRGEVRFAWAGATRAEWVDVYDVIGARRWGRSIEPGALALAWQGTDSAGRRLPAGVYYARLTGKGASATARIVIVQ